MNENFIYSVIKEFLCIKNTLYHYNTTFKRPDFALANGIVLTFN